MFWKVLGILTFLTIFFSSLVYDFCKPLIKEPMILFEAVFNIESSFFCKYVALDN